MYAKMHEKTSPVHFIPLYKFPSVKQRLICHYAGAAKPRPRASLQGPRHPGKVAVLQGQSRAGDFQAVKRL